MNKSGRRRHAGAQFDRLGDGVGTQVIKAAVRTPNMNPVAGKFVGSPRREALDHVLLLGEHQLEGVAQDYVLCFNTARPHQGIGQLISDGPANDNYDGKIGICPPRRCRHLDQR